MFIDERYTKAMVTVLVDYEVGHCSPSETHTRISIRFAFDNVKQNNDSGGLLK